MKYLTTGTRRRPVELVTFGMAGDLSVPGMRSHHLGRLDGDGLLAQLYSAGDVTVVPSTWDNLPLTALESIACGTPLVAFDTATGLPDVIDHRKNGYLARGFDPQDLARGIDWVVEDPRRQEALSRDARAKAVREFSLDTQTQRYLSLFSELVERRGVTVAR